MHPPVRRFGLDACDAQAIPCDENPFLTVLSNSHTTTWWQKNIIGSKGYIHSQDVTVTTRLIRRIPTRHFLGYRGGGLPPVDHTQHSQANPTAGGPRQSLTSEIRPTPLSQQVPSARTKKAWDQTLCLHTPQRHHTHAGTGVGGARSPFLT